MIRRMKAHWVYLIPLLLTIIACGEDAPIRDSNYFLQYCNSDLAVQFVSDFHAAKNEYSTCSSSPGACRAFYEIDTIRALEDCGYSGDATDLVVGQTLEGMD